MRPHNTLFFGMVLLLIGIGLSGCSSESRDDNKGTLHSTAPINNSAPEAKTAPAAPVDPSIIYPGDKLRKNKVSQQKSGG